MDVNGSISIKACSDGCFERLIVFSVLEQTDHRLGREPMSDRVVARAQLAFFRNRTGAVASIAPVASICLNEVMEGNPFLIWLCFAIWGSGGRSCLPFSIAI